MSKSEENEQKEAKNTQIVIDVLEANEEKEIKNVIVKPDSKEHPQPCSSIMTESEIEVTRMTDQVTRNLHNDQINNSQDYTSHYKRQNEFRIDTESNLSVEELSNISETSIINEVAFVISPPNNRILPRTENLPETVPTSSQGRHRINFPDDDIIQSLQNSGPPPSYSKSLLDRKMNTCASIQFIAPIPPPSYDGMNNPLRYVRQRGITLGLANTWLAQPQPAYCSTCETVTITQIDIRISRIAHIIAIILFLLLCWPFCFLPYFFNSCNYTMHYCSVCHTYLGSRRPFQRT